MDTMVYIIYLSLLFFLGVFAQEMIHCSFRVCTLTMNTQSSLQKQVRLFDFCRTCLVAKEVMTPCAVFFPESCRDCPAVPVLALRMKQQLHPFAGLSTQHLFLKRLRVSSNLQEILYTKILYAVSSCFVRISRQLVFVKTSIDCTLQLSELTIFCHLERHSL